MRQSRCVLLAAVALLGAVRSSCGETTVVQWADRVVKLYGAGGTARVESYGSGVLISPQGHIATVLGPFLDASEVGVVISTGRRLPARLLRVEPGFEIAILKIEGQNLPHFECVEHPEPTVGDSVILLSNPFGIAVGDDIVSVARAHVSARTRFQGRQGRFAIRYPEPVLILDRVTANPGCAGGAVVDRAGYLVGLIGREAKDGQTDIWANHALPIRPMLPFLRSVVQSEPSERAAAASPVSTAPMPERKPEDDRSIGSSWRGISFVPDLFDRTPPFVDAVAKGTVADRAGVRPDDLLVFIGEDRVTSVADAVHRLLQVPIDRPLSLTFLRRERLVVVTLDASASTQAKKTPGPEKPQ